MFGSFFFGSQYFGGLSSVTRIIRKRGKPTVIQTKVAPTVLKTNHNGTTL